MEGFHPGGPYLYRRVLVPVQANRVVFPAWLRGSGIAGPVASRNSPAVLNELAIEPGVEHRASSPISPLYQSEPERKRSVNGPKRSALLPFLSKIPPTL